MAMTYLEILGWARKGVIAEKENYPASYPRFHTRLR